jgi:hypothetical protein
MTDPTSPRFRLLTVRDLRDRPEPVDVVQGLIPAGGNVMLYGPSGSGKSFAALDMALNVAGGAADWFGHRIRPGAVVYLVGEGQGAFHRRVAAWLRAQHMEDVANIRFMYDAVQLLELPDVGALVDAIRAWVPEPAVIFADTLHACMPGGDENSAKDCGLVVHSLNYVRRETGAAVVLLHHPMKHGDMERGSSSLKAAMDVVLKLASDDDGMLTLSSTKVKDGPPLEALTLRLVGFDGSAIVCAPDATGKAKALSPNERKALDALASIALDDGVTCSQWGDSSGLSEATFMRVRKRLVDGKHVIVTKKRYRVAQQVDTNDAISSQSTITALSGEPGYPAAITASPPLEKEKHDSEAPIPKMVGGSEEWGDAWEPEAA